MDFPGPSQQFLPDTICPDWAKPYALHHQMRIHGQDILEPALRKIFADLSGRRDVVPNGKLCTDYRRVLREAEATYLSKHKFDIIFCTSREASGGRIKRHESLTPRQCIIDDCGMVSEPESIILISLCDHVVLIGDHKQLQPEVNYQPARDNGLSTSLFERYAKYYKDYVFVLSKQYVMVRASNIMSVHSQHRRVLMGRGGRKWKKKFRKVRKDLREGGEMWRRGGPMSPSLPK